MNHEEEIKKIYPYSIKAARRHGIHLPILWSIPLIIISAVIISNFIVPGEKYLASTQEKEIAGIAMAVVIILLIIIMIIIPILEYKALASRLIGVVTEKDGKILYLKYNKTHVDVGNELYYYRGFDDTSYWGARASSALFFLTYTGKVRENGRKMRDIKTLEFMAHSKLSSPFVKEIVKIHEIKETRKRLKIRCDYYDYEAGKLITEKIINIPKAFDDLQSLKQDIEYLYRK